MKRVHVTRDVMFDEQA
jgi:hypothetical protein